jgi:hypothetical protein
MWIYVWKELGSKVHTVKEKKKREICKANQSKVAAIALQNLLDGRHT